MKGIPNNVTGGDRVLRIGLGGGLLSLYLMDGPWYSLFAAIPFLTGLFGFCPLYAIFRRNRKD